LVAVVLAAGVGSRLRPLTDALPKCLLEVAGRPLLDRLIEAARAAGLARMVVVTGHRHADIASHVRRFASVLEIDLVENAAYAATNNAVSLAAAREVVGPEGFVLCDADIVFSVNPLPPLMAQPDDCALAVDVAAPWTAEAMKVERRRDGSVARISKQIEAGASGGESIGVQKVGPASAPRLWDALTTIVAEAPGTAYYEDAFQLMIDRGVRFGVSAIQPGSVMEIDDHADLAAARGRFGP
jgi:choline kinase